MRNLPEASLTKRYIQIVLEDTEEVSPPRPSSISTTTNLRSARSYPPASSRPFSLTNCEIFDPNDQDWFNHLHAWEKGREPIITEW